MHLRQKNLKILIIQYIPSYKLFFIGFIMALCPEDIVDAFLISYFSSELYFTIFYPIFAAQKIN